MARETIFLSYRRDDTADVAGRIFDAMASRFGRDRVFMDVDNVGPGVDFGEYIRSVLPRCRVALILIGPKWLESEDGNGHRRLDDDHDWVRIEIETALGTPGLLVVPVLVNGARMPHGGQLPESLKLLLRRNAAIIRRDPDFHDDVERLATALRASVNTGFVDLNNIGGRTGRVAGAFRGRDLFVFGGAVTIASALVAGSFGLARWSPLATHDQPSREPQKQHTYQSHQAGRSALPTGSTTTQQEQAHAGPEATASAARTAAILPKSNPSGERANQEVHDQSVYEAQQLGIAQGAIPTEPARTSDTFRPSTVRGASASPDFNAFLGRWMLDDGRRECPRAVDVRSLDGEALDAQYRHGGWGPQPPVLRYSVVSISGSTIRVRRLLGSHEIQVDDGRLLIWFDPGVDEYNCWYVRGSW